MHRSIRAIIVNNGQILLIYRQRDGVDPYYVFPGGGVEPGDGNNEDTIRRECLEELGIRILVGRCLGTVTTTDLSKQEWFYACEYLDGVLGSGQGDEITNSQRGIYQPTWITIKALSTLRVLPVEALKFVQDT